MLIVSIVTDYRKDKAHPPGHGYGRNVGTAQRPIWVAGRPGPIDTVVVHATHGRTGSAAGNEARYLRDSPGVSANDLIGRDGTLYEILPDTAQAWHAGAVVDPRWGNARSYGIELQASTTEPITAAQKATLAWRLLDLRSRYHIGAPDVRSHRSIAAPPGRKSDPATWPDADLNRWVATLFATALRPDPLPMDAYTANSPLMGAPRASEAQAVAFILARPHGEYSEVAVREIVGAYWDQAVLLGLDPVLAVAQMCHETGNLTSPRSQRPQRNPAGIGASNDGAQGAFFATWVDHAIPAHLGRLLAYAVAPNRRSPEQQRLVNVAMAVRGLPAKLHGSAPTLKELGAAHNPVNVGVPKEKWMGWAVEGWDYGAKIAAIANRIRSLPIAE